MPTKQLMKHCYHCNKSTLHIQQTPNHLLHLVLSVLTAGIWLIVWIFTKSSEPTCTSCGLTEQAAKKAAKQAAKQAAKAAQIYTPTQTHVQTLNRKPVSRSSEKIKLGFAILCVILLLFVVISGSPSKNEQNKAIKSSDLPVEARQKYFDEFLKNPDAVLERLNAAIKNREWNKAVSIAEYYLPTNHPEIVKLHALATKGRDNPEKGFALPTTTTTADPNDPESSGKQKYLDEFLKSPDAALARLRAAIKNEEWNKALTIAEYYLPTKHPEIIKLHAVATRGKNNTTNRLNNELQPPFFKPFQYIGLSLAEASKKIGVKPNSAGNIIVDKPSAHMQVSTSGGSHISYIDIQLSELNTCLQSRAFDSIPMLAKVGISAKELELARKQTHYHTYYDHRRKLKVFVTCLDDGMPYTVGISKKYYLN